MNEIKSISKIILWDKDIEGSEIRGQPHSSSEEITWTRAE
jgi:hypothetical protein